MKTPEEVKKALECCASLGFGNCARCPYNNDAQCVHLVEDGLAYIKHLEANMSNLLCDFMDYVCDGVQNPAPYCAFASDMCVDERGWCRRGSVYCNGFLPKVRDDDENA